MVCNHRAIRKVERVCISNKKKILEATASYSESDLMPTPSLDLKLQILSI